MNKHLEGLQKAEDELKLLQAQYVNIIFKEEHEIIFIIFKAH